MSGTGHRSTVARLYGVAFVLILLAAGFLASALFTDGDGTSAPLVAFVASGGGLFLLAVGVLRTRRPARPGA